MEQDSDYQNSWDINQQQAVELDHDNLNTPNDVEMDKEDWNDYRFMCSLENTQICNNTQFEIMPEIGEVDNECLPFLNMPRSSYKSLSDYSLDYYLQWKYRASPDAEYPTNVWMH